MSEPAPLLQLTKTATGVAILRIHRPEARNALNVDLRRQLAETFEALDQDEAVRAVVLTGSDKVFVSGADIKVLAEMDVSAQLVAKLHLYWEAIARFSKPIVVAVEGYALGGGCELAMHGDILIAGENAKFGQPEVKLGIMPGAGGTQRLVRAIGKFKTMLLTLTGDLISGREAFEYGLVSKVVEDGKAEETALEIATRIAALPPLAVRQIKEVVAAGEDAPLDTALRLERKAFQLLFGTRDKNEGTSAFLEKRKPEFRGC